MNWALVFFMIKIYIQEMFLWVGKLKVVIKVFRGKGKCKWSNLFSKFFGKGDKGLGL